MCVLNSCLVHCLLSTQSKCPAGENKRCFPETVSKGCEGTEVPFIHPETPIVAHHNKTWHLASQGFCPAPQNLTCGAKEIFWTFLARWTWTDALDSGSVNGRSRCVKPSPWLRPSCGFHLSSKLCWSALAEQHPSGMYQVLSTAVFVLCKEDTSRAVQSA